MNFNFTNITVIIDNYKTIYNLNMTDLHLLKLNSTLCSFKDS